METNNIRLVPMPDFDGAAEGIHAYIQLDPDRISPKHTVHGAMMFFAQWDPKRCNFRPLLAMKKSASGTTRKHGIPCDPGCEGVSPDLVLKWAPVGFIIDKD